MMLRTFGLISTLVLGLVAGPLPTEAQQPTKVYRVGYLSANRYVSREAAFLQGLRELGYIEGQNIVIEWRHSKGKRGPLSGLAADLVRLEVDCMVTTGTGGTRAAQKATSTIPIVMANVGDPIGRGFIASLARPGGNITGPTTLSGEIAGKRLELLKEAFPKLSQLAVVLDPTHHGPYESHVREIEAAAPALGLSLEYLEVRGPDDFENAFRKSGDGRQKAFMVLTTRLMHRHRARIINLAAKTRLPVMYSDPRFVFAGGLMGYGPDRDDQYRRAATYVDKILRGAKPTDLPVEQPRKFELVINLKTAKQLGIAIPPEVLYQATKVIK